MELKKKNLVFAEQLLSDRIILRVFKEEEAPTLKQRIDESLDHLASWFPWADEGTKPVQVHLEKIRDFKQRFENGTDYCYGVFDRETGKLLGSAGLHTRQGEGILEIGYWIAKDSIRKGYAKEAARLLMSEAFKQPTIEKVVIQTDENNIASYSVAKSIGLAYEYTYRRVNKNKDGSRNRTAVWSIFREELP